MPRFRFNLQSVLDQRKREEEDIQRRVAVLERQRLDQESLIREFQIENIEERSGLRRTLRAELGSGEPAAVDLFSARLSANAALHMIARAQRAVLVLAGIHEKLDAERLRLLDAARRRKSLEILRDRRYEEWNVAQKRREESAADELAVMRASRRKDDP